MKVCILAAGTGSRLSTLAKLTHKALLPLGNRAVISRIMDQFPKDSEFVIAVGHRSEEIQNLICLAHPSLAVRFVQVDPYEGPGSGPGYSLYSCRQYLQEPFVFTACDTLISENLPPFERSWIGVTRVTDIEKWCSAQVDSQNQVVDLFYKKGHVPTDLAFTGIAFVKEYQDFWTALDSNYLRSKGGGESSEFQVNEGLLALRAHQLSAFPLKWEDTGTLENYRKLSESYEENYSFAGKTTELTYRYDNQIIKSFPTESDASNRLERSLQANGVFCKVLARRGSFLSYEFHDGSLLSNYLDYNECRRFLNWMELRFWQVKQVDLKVFEKTCSQFYLDKTFDRLKMLEKNNPLTQHFENETIQINSRQCLPVRTILEKTQVLLTQGGLSSTYHGDLHGDNVIQVGSDYILIDWRGVFGDSVHIGDRYYDLAKFLHTLDLSVSTMKAPDAYRVVQTAEGWDIDHECSFKQVEARDAFWQFCQEKGYHLQRIRLINGIVFINMAPLYDDELGRYLYLLGRYIINSAVM